MHRSILWGGLVAAVLCSAGAASADTEGRWAAVQDWSNSARTAMVAVPGSLGFPAAALTSNTAGSAGPETGATRWLGGFTGPGSRYGSSQGRQYLGLRPAANNASSPSTSVYTFERPTPAGGWMLALGDIDAEYLDVSAVGIDGQPVAIADLGFRSAFNYCQGSPRPSGCDASKAQPVPLWDAGAARLAGPQVDDAGDPIPGWTDTDGAAAWFEPSVSLTSITVRSTWRSGFPTYQTWFAALSRDISGTVAGSTECSSAGLAVTLRDGSGAEVASTTTSDDGTWSFDDLATFSDWQVEVDAPAGCAVADGATRTADLSSGDAVIGFELEAVTGAVGGTVSDEDGEGVADVELTLQTPDEQTSTVVTADDGSYGPAELPIGESTLTVETPDGYTVVGEDEATLSVTDEGQALDADFTLRADDDETPVDPPVEDEDPTESPAPADTPGSTVDATNSAAVLPDAGGPDRRMLPTGLSLLLAGGAMTWWARRRPSC